MCSINRWTLRVTQSCTLSTCSTAYWNLLLSFHWFSLWILNHVGDSKLQRTDPLINVNRRAKIFMEKNDKTTSAMHPFEHIPQSSAPVPLFFAFNVIDTDNNVHDNEQLSNAHEQAVRFIEIFFFCISSRESQGRRNENELIRESLSTKQSSARRRYPHFPQL